MSCKGLYKVTENNFESFLSKSSLPVILIVGTEWCSDTTRIINESLPVVIELYRNKINFVYLMLEKAINREKINIGLSEQLKVTRYPTIIYYSNGKEKGRLVSEGNTEQQIKDLLQAIDKVI